MGCSTKGIGKLAAALGGAAVLSISAFLPVRPSSAAVPPLPQDAAKTVEVKVQVPATGPAPPPADVFVGKQVNQKIGVIRLDKPAAPPVPSAEQVAQAALQQLRPSFRAELRLLTSAAEPSPSQRTEIAVEAGKILRAVALKSASARNGNQVVVARANVQVAGQANANDPRTQARHALEVASKERLSFEQIARYRQEIERKAQDRREAVVLNLVANIDKLLSLNADQREKLCESFRAHWDDRDYPSIEMSTTYDAYLPSIPDPHIVPTLSTEQVKIWRGARKINFSALRNNPNAVNNNNQAVDPGDDEEDPDVKAALAPPEAKK